MKTPTPKKLPSGAWRCQVMVGGQRASVTAPTEKEALAKALALKAGLRQQIKEEQQRRVGALTLSDAIDRYIAERNNVLSPSTITGYRVVQRNRFPSLMRRSVAFIELSDLQAAINTEAVKVSAKTIKNSVGLIVSVLSQYKEINVNRLRLPQRVQKEHPFLDAAGIVALFDAIRGQKAELPILLGVWLGLRRSEIMGLCWDCVDLNAGTLTIRRTYLNQPEGGFAIREGTKTEASKRTLELPGYIAQKLADYCSPEKRVGRVFKMHPNTIYKQMRTLCEEHGIEFVGIHGLRHTNATVMLSLGILDKVTMAMGGWSTDVTMKKVYQHVFQSDVSRAGDIRNDFFKQLLDRAE